MRVLLVDHDSEGLETIARAIRGVLELDCVTSKGDALLLLRQNQYDVLIACERAVDGSGLDLLARTTRTTVPLKRIFAAAPERLQLLGPRLAPFKVQRTINYPIDLEELWLAIAQVTSGPNEETDGTIERVVLDERGIPSTGTTPRSPIPPRPPAPLGNFSPPAATAIATAAAHGRAATVRVAQPAPAPEPPPPRSQPARLTGAAGRVPQMRATAPAIQAIPPMPVQAAPAPTRDSLPTWTPEVQVVEDDFAAVAEQARLGVQQKTVDDAARRKKLRLATACGIAVAVAALIVFAIEKFYDPDARAREEAIAATVQKMDEERKFTDGLARIEIEIEEAIMKNEFDAARGGLEKLTHMSPTHPRLEFLKASINRAEELSKLAQADAADAAPTQAGMTAAPTSTARNSNQNPRSRNAERRPERAPERVATRTPERAAPRAQRDTAAPSRTYGAPIGEPPRKPSIKLDAPIGTLPTTTARNTPNSAFGGRTLEASDGSGSGSVARATVPPAAAPTTAIQNTSDSAGSAVVAVPPASTPAPTPPPAVDVVQAKIVKRVTPVAPAGISRKTSGYVLLRFSISHTGKVSDVEVLESEPRGVFDDVAQSAVRKWVYEPRRENGIAVPTTARARLIFEPKN